MTGFNANGQQFPGGMIRGMARGALIFAGHQIIESIAVGEGHGTDGTGEAEIGIITLPDIGQGIPAAGLLYHQAGFHQLKVIGLNRAQVPVPV